MNARTNKLLFVGLFLIILIMGTFFIVTESQKKTKIQSNASASTKLTFEPSTTSGSPLQKRVGDTISFDVMVDPGNNLPNLIQLKITYDATKLTPTSSPFVVNSQAFPSTLEGPVARDGNVYVTVSTGSDPSKVIQTITKVGTINFTAASQTTQPVSISFANATRVFSAAPTDEATTNVLSTAIPAYVSISSGDTEKKNTTLTCSPATITLTNQGRPLEARLREVGGSFLNGKAVSWSSQNSAVRFEPESSQTNTEGRAASSVAVSGNPASFTTTLTAKFEADSTHKESTCDISATYGTAPPPDGTRLLLNVFLHGIGRSGDNVNPTNSSESNQNPKHITRAVKIEAFDTLNRLVTSETGELTYDTGTGSFKGVIQLGDRIPRDGVYNFKLQVPNHLKKLVTGTQIQIGQPNTLIDVHLIAGDVREDNVLDIRDYNIMRDCFSDLAGSVSCTSASKGFADLNDDGKVDLTDLNLYLREILVRQGD